MGTRELLASLPTGTIRVDLSSTNVTTGAYATLSASIPSSCSAITVAYTGEGILTLAKGAAAAEVDLPLRLTPGMQPTMLHPLNLAKAIRLSAKALDQNVTSGELVINLYG